ncbi:MAG: radical SAM protein [Parachlamydiales bacterium]
MNSKLNLIEIFRSVQGETSYTGLPTTFIRLAACNLRCTWCDTTYSFGRGEPWEVEVIIDKVKEFGCKYVCVTGGEPLLQKDVHTLMNRLCEAGYKLSLETGGSLPIAHVHPDVKIILDLKCPGSGMSAKNYWGNIPILKGSDEVKFVLLDRVDYEWARDVCHKHGLTHLVEEVLLSPVHGKLDPKDLIQWMLEDALDVRLNLQVHKFIWDPETKGV